jgi:hypothetical protein
MEMHRNDVVSWLKVWRAHFDDMRNDSFESGESSFLELNETSVVGCGSFREDNYWIQVWIIFTSDLSCKDFSKYLRF